MQAHGAEKGQVSNSPHKTELGDKGCQGRGDGSFVSDAFDCCVKAPWPRQPREIRIRRAFCRKLGKTGPLILNYGKSTIKAQELGHMWSEAVYWKEVAGRVMHMSPKLPTHGA